MQVIGQADGNDSLEHAWRPIIALRPPLNCASYQVEQAMAYFLAFGRS